MNISQYCIDWPTVMIFLNSTFTTSLLGAMFGAMAGAIAAQKITDRAKEKEHYTSQLRTTNSAIMSCLVIANTALSLKWQYLQDLYSNLFTQIAAFEEYKRKIDIGELAPGTLFNFNADLRIVSMQQVPIAILESQMFERLSIDGRPLALTSAISSALTNLQEALSKRNDLISEFKGLRSHEQNIFPFMYFGCKRPDGNISTEYPDSVMGAYKYNDDVIFFSKLLCNDLQNHGARIKELYEKRYGSDNRKVSTADFSIAKERGLLPNESAYADWLTGFVTKEASK